jgi:hypothetical protein
VDVFEQFLRKESKKKAQVHILGPGDPQILKILTEKRPKHSF